MNYSNLLQKNINLKVTTKSFVLKHTTIYVHYVNLLIWSPTKLDFFILCFLCFSMIFQRFSGKKEKTKPPSL